MKKSKMTKSKFINLLYDEGWDIAVKQCRKKTNNPNIKLLCDVYNTAYPTEGFQTADAPNRRAGNADRRDYGISRFRESALLGRTWRLVHET